MGDEKIETRFVYGEGHKRTVCHLGLDRKGRKQLDGEYTEYYNMPGEIIKKRGEYKGGYIHGEWTEYYQDGKISSISIWNQRKMISMKEFDQNGNVIKDYKEE